jgi:glycyl-tRNA synthetase beta chain
MPADLLLELGSEELPASFIAPALEALAQGITKGLDAARLKHGDVRRYGTPRRLAILIERIADVGEDVKKEVQGPSVKAGFKDGVAQIPAKKFAESVGKRPEELERVTTPKGEYLVATVEEKGKRASEILPQVLYAAAHALRFPKSMRWGDVDLMWARPLHWIVALLGRDVVPVIYSDVKSGRKTRGHRFLAPEPLEIAQPADYVGALEKAHVIVDFNVRKQAVEEGARRAAAAAGGTLLEDPSLVEQVTNLVELPCPLVGAFEERHLDLPAEVLIQEMRTHQRYFAVQGPKGGLLPKFIAISNTPVKDTRVSVRGYERVLRARLTDGRYFFDLDKKTRLEDQVPRLARVTWQNELGSYLQKVERMRALSRWLAERTGHAAELAVLERAATLAKADLVTGMVGEFPELQGVMGREYALASGEPAAVAAAIFEHYQPRNAGEKLPDSDVGAILGVADRLDTLIGIFGIGEGPTGAKDPYALRRAALAVIHILLGKTLRFDLDLALAEAVKLYRDQGVAKGKGGKPFGDGAPVREFFVGRLRAEWAEEARPDLVEAVLATDFGDLVQMRRRLAALQALVASPDFNPLAVTFKRVANIVAKQAKDVEPGAVDAALFREPQETDLFHQIQTVRGEVEQLSAQDDFSGVLSRLATLRPWVDALFDHVMVIAEDKALQENRVRLLQSISALFRHVGDFAQIQAE